MIKTYELGLPLNSRLGDLGLRLNFSRACKCNFMWFPYKDGNISDWYPYNLYLI